MSNFHYVYILVDEATGTHFYIGCTEDLKSRAAFPRFRLGKPVAQTSEHGVEDCRGVICEADEAGQHGIAPPQTLL